MSTDDHDWRAGAASRRITPEDSSWMAGFAHRDRPSQGVASELYADALALEDADGRRFVAVGVDVLGVPADLRAAVAEECRADLDLPPESLLLTASHTHCGPELRPARVRMENWGVDADEERIREYRAALRDRIVDAVRGAVDDLAPASVGYSRGYAGFAMNRRYRTADGDILHVKNPDGRVDHDVPVLRVDGPDGSIRAIAFGYACHNTTLNFDRFSGDWAGHAKAFLREAHPDATPLFLTGCAGDQNPYPRGDPAHAEAHGRAVANAVEAAITAESDGDERPPSMTPVEGPLSIARGTVELDFEDVPDETELAARLDADDPAVRNHARVLCERVAEEGSLPETYDYPIQGVRFGSDLSLVALAGEPVVEYAHRLSDALPGPVWVAGYSNADPGYVPTPRVLHEGGYEGEGWVRYWHNPSAFAYSTEERIVDGVRGLFDRR